MQIHELNTFVGTPGETDFFAIDTGFDTAKISAPELLKQLSYYKLNRPLDVNNVPTDGASGQILRTRGDGSTEWSDVGLPTDAQTAQAVNDWLDAHPEATTTVVDGSLTMAKFALGAIGFITPEMFGAVGDGVTDDSTAIQDAINYAIAHSAWLDGLNKEYIVSDAVVLPPDLSPTEKGIYINGSLYMRNFRLKLKADVSDLTTVLNIVTNPGDLTIVENVTINGNRTNQSQVTTPTQDGGLHGMRIGLTNIPMGKVIISDCKIADCYSDGILARSTTFDQLIIEKSIITTSGRNGITDNSYSSLIDSCIIINNGTRTAPKSGYHIEPDESCNFGIKKITNCFLVNNVTADFKIHFNSDTYNIEKLSVTECKIGSCSWANYSTSACVHKKIEFINCEFGAAFSYYVNSYTVQSVFDKMLIEGCVFSDTLAIHGAADSSNPNSVVNINNCKLTQVLFYKSFESVTIDKCERIIKPAASADSVANNLIYFGYYDADTSHTRLINSFVLSNGYYYGTNRIFEFQDAYLTVKVLSLINNVFYNRTTILRAYSTIFGSIFVLNNLINIYTGLTVPTILTGSTTCVNLIATNNMSTLSESRTFGTSVVTNSITDNNLYSATL